jgi:integrase
MNQSRIVQNKFYNEFAKAKFLNQYQETSKKVYARIFNLSQPVEDSIKIDLYEFNEQSIEKLLHMLNPATVVSARNNTSLISSYMNWAIKEGLRKDDINPLSDKTSSWYLTFVKPITELTYEKLIKYVKRCENAQDAIILLLLFEGVKGDAFAEILQLREQDVDMNTCELTLTNLDQSVRKIAVNIRTIQLIQSALSEKEYLKLNGEASHATKNAYTTLVSNEYVIRSSITRNENVYVADKFIIYRRLTVLSKVLNEPMLNASMIERSGMLHMAKFLLDRDGKLEREQYEQISERFNISKRMNNGILEYNYYPLKDFIDEKKVRELYS